MSATRRPVGPDCYDTTVYDGEGSLDLLAQHGVEVVHLADDKARKILEEFITYNREAWLADIGK